MQFSRSRFATAFAVSCFAVSSQASAQMGACCDTSGGCTVTLQVDCSTESAWIEGAACMPSGCPENFEVEPNNLWTQPNTVTLSSGETFSGVQHQFTDIFSEEITDSTSRDMWEVTTAPLPPGIYRHAISPVVNARLSIVIARMQFDGVIAEDYTTTSDILGTSVWYGFGKEESMLLMILGYEADPGPYTFQLTTTPVMPTVASGTVTSGPVTVTVEGVDQYGYVDVDTWLYDSDFNPVPEAGNDDSSGDPAAPSIFTKSLPAGDYYLAVAVVDLASDQPSPPSDSFRDGSLLEYPNVVTSGNQFVLPEVFYGVTIADTDNATSDAVQAGLIITGDINTGIMADIAWVKFTVTGAPCAADFNGVNGVTVQDIFDFLTAWLAGNASADFNGVNGVTVQDIFDFLTAWLAGC